ncbi:MAG: hypothetical protein AMJ84_10180 [Acidithiobacillales bacterium SM23_46]|nr:MAG: hypothetical protein AMJ84_10180 [Acidithiobacillales bacterium SM23_46]
MIAIWLAALLAGLLGPGSRARAAVSSTATLERPTTKPVNLVRNGGFELGDKWPSGWLIRFARKDLSHLTDIRALDNLTLFWDSSCGTTRPTAGKCIRMDTDVNQGEVHRRMEELIADPAAPPWRKTPTRPPKYDTAAGLEGVSLWSDPIPVNKDKIYRMSVDVIGQMSGIFFPKMFVRGYGMAKNVKGQLVKRELYETYVSCRVFKRGQWYHFAQTFCPTDRTPAVTEIRVTLYAYWPPGLYYWDNVEITEVPEAEAALIHARKTKDRALGDKKTARPTRRTPRKRKAGESFVIEEEEPLDLPEK